MELYPYYGVPHNTVIPNHRFAFSQSRPTRSILGKIGNHERLCQILVCFEAGSHEPPYGDLCYTPQSEHFFGRFFRCCKLKKWIPMSSRK